MLNAISLIIKTLLHLDFIYTRPPTFQDRDDNVTWMKSRYMIYTTVIYLTGKNIPMNRLVQNLIFNLELIYVIFIACLFIIFYNFLI